MKYLERKTRRLAGSSWPGDKSVALQRVDHSLAVSSLWLDSVVHDFVPILAGQNLKDREQSDRERVEVRWRRSLGKVELAAEQLHAEQCENQNEQEEQEQQWDDGSHGVQQRDHEISQRRPVFGDFEDTQQS